MFNLLEINMSDLSSAFQAAAIGIALVFLILGLLMLIVFGSKHLTRLIDKKITPAFVVFKAKRAEKKALLQNAQGIVLGNVSDDSEVAAVIAAINMILSVEANEQGVEPVEFVVKQIKRVR